MVESETISAKPKFMNQEAPKFSWAQLILTILFLMLNVVVILQVGGSLNWNRNDPQAIQDSMIVLAAGLVFALFQGIVVYFGIYLFSWLYYRFWQKEAIESELENIQKDIDKDFFTNLVRLNFKYIDKYYLQTQVQADKSFILSCIAAVVALIITVVGIIMMFRGYTQPAYVTTAAGVLGELVASVFFYLYNQTVIKMGEYHQKLVLTQNISLALKICEEMKEPERSQSKSSLIEALSKDVNMYLSAQAQNYTNSQPAKQKADA